MGHRRGYVILAFASALAYCQATPPLQRSSQTEREKCSIEGRVIRASDGAPLKKAVVTAVPQQPQPPTLNRPLSTSTDADGKFVLRDFDSGRYTLVAVRTGYVRQTYGQRTANGPGTTLTLLDGQHLREIIFRLSAGAAISGRVTDEDSEPIPGVRVQALRWGYRNGKRELVPGGGYATTDDRGEYRMFQLAPGSYYISANYSGGLYLGGGVSYGKGDIGDETYPPTYYPGVVDAGQASAINVRPGDEVLGINFRLLLSHAVRITGRVLKSGGEPSRGAPVSLFPKHMTGFASVRRGASTDAHGAFEIRGVTSGSYVLWAESDDGGNRSQARSEMEVADSDIEGVVLVLRPPIEVPGKVRLDGNIDLQSAHVRVILTSGDFSPLGGGSSAVVNSDQTFTLGDLNDGDYTIRLFGLPGDAYVASAAMGKRDVLRDGVSLRGKGEPLQIVLSAAGGRLEGSVISEQNQPFAGARVVLVPDESRRKRQDLFKVTSSDQYGHFSIRGITPGKYKLFAWENVDEGAYYDPDFLRAYDDLGRSVDIPSSAYVTQDVKLVRPDGAAN